MTSPTHPLPLEGVTVVDLSRALAGPYCTALLADLGARVIKVESGSGDPARNWPPFDGDHSLYFDSTNRNKQSLWVDLYSEEGRVVLDELLARADVLVENFKTGTLAAMGYPLARLKEINDGLILASVSAYGAHGPMAEHAGLDQVIQARAGMTSVTGPADGEAYRVGLPVVDIASGMTAAVGIVALLYGREHGRTQRHVSTSLYETAVSMSVFQGQKALTTGEAPRRQGNDHPSITPYGAFATQTEPIVIAVSTEKHFRSFAELLGHSEWTQDERFATSRARTEHRGALTEAVETALAERPAAAWIEAIGSLGIPCGPIQDYVQVMADEQTHALDLIAATRRGDGSELSVVRGPLTLDGVPAEVRSAPPLLSEHADEVLSSIGVDRARADELRRNDIVR